MQKIVDINNIKKEKNSVENIFKLLSSSDKSIPTKYLYDQTGSKLFEKICKTKDYYLTRLEQNILKSNASNIINRTKPMDMFEFGSGSSKKTALLINAHLKSETNLSYSSLDISSEALNMSFEQISRISNTIDVNLFKGDFLGDLNKIKLENKNRLFLFLGSTLGNFTNETAISFLKNIRKIMKMSDYLLMGVDMVKDENIIKSAYDDRDGITKNFNKNILKVLNNKFNLNFKQNNYLHQAEFNKKESQIEMYLVSKNQHTIDFPNNSNILINAGDKILTEISRKFSKDIIDHLIQKSNMEIEEIYQDDRKFYSLLLIRLV